MMLVGSDNPELSAGVIVSTSLAPRSEAVRRRCRAVLLLAPGWPPGEIANGIISTVATAKKGLESIGVPCSVLSFSRIYRGQDPHSRVFHVSSFDKRSQVGRIGRGLANRLVRALVGRSKRWTVHNPPIETRGFGTAIAYFERCHGINIIEVEESFGLPGFVVKHASAPIVTRLHGPWFLNGAANGCLRDEAFSGRVNIEGEGIVHSQGVTSPSRFVLSATEDRYGIRFPLCAVIPNSVEPAAPTSYWNPRGAESDHILFVGRFDLHKGADVCVHAFAEVLKKRPDARLTLVGPDHGIIDPVSGTVVCAANWIRKEVSAVVAGRIDLPGKLTRGAIMELRQRAAVTVVPSRFENFSMTTIEAMAQGCPLVASRVGGIAEIIDEGRNGLLCGVSNSSDLAAKILALLENRELAATLGGQARRDSVDRFSPTAVAARSMQFYEEVCARAYFGHGGRESSGAAYS